jgi:hypothetical protein
VKPAGHTADADGCVKSHSTEVPFPDVNNVNIRETETDGQEYSSRRQINVERMKQTANKT